MILLLEQISQSILFQEVNSLQSVVILGLHEMIYDLFFKTNKITASSRFPSLSGDLYSLRESNSHLSCGFVFF